MIGMVLLVIFIAALIGTALIVSGRWRAAFCLFAISPKRMTVRKLGLRVTDPLDIERVNSILKHFITGFNRMLTAPRMSECQTLCDAKPVVYRPFAQEGVAMGYTLREMFRYDPARFEQQIVRPRPEYRYLYYVGLGFWSGMRNHKPDRVVQRTQGLDAMHRFLVFDGYGFKIAFFDHPKNAAALGRLDEFEGYARHAAYQGVGRAFFFRFMSDPDELIRRLSALGEWARDAAAGVGLAAVFVNPDRFQIPVQLAQRMPVEWQPHYHLGMCFALKARSINDLDEFQRNISRLDPSAQDAVYAAVRQCDRIELLVRSDGIEDGYRRWRESVTAWMAERIVYPLAGLQTADTSGDQLPATNKATEEIKT